jgi:hypothetical protein
MDQNVNMIVTVDQKNNVNSYIGAINTNLVGMINLSEENKLHASKMGPDTYDYCVTAKKLINQNPTLVPQWVNVAKVEQDFATYDELQSIQLLLNQLSQKVDDTMVQLGIQLKKNADDFYHNAQAANSRGGIPGANSVVDEIKAFYAKSQKEQPAVVPA